MASTDDHDESPEPIDPAGEDCPPVEVLEAIAAGMTMDGDLSRHLAGCSECHDALTRLRTANDLLDEAAAGIRGLGDAVDEVPGYELLREIHRGGQGVVWLAEQDGTRREVAIKMLLAGRFATSRQRRRFEREIEVVASLRHPSIVTVFESGVTVGGQIYCAMEFVEGATLDAWRKETSPSITDGVQMLERVANAVATAHRRGVIHRDLKPANVLVSSDGIPHVLDFGLARLENERDTDRAELLATEAGEFLGTFTYAAPEQLSGDPSSVDTRADVYALGLLLFEVVAGERPFPKPASVADLVTHRVEAVAPRLSSRRRGVGRELDLIVARALDPDPARRYETAGDLADDLRRLQDGRPVRARGDSLGYLVWKAVQRHRLPAAFAATVAVLVIASAISLFVLYRQSEARRRQAERVQTSIVQAFRYLNPQEEGSMDLRPPDLIARLEQIAIQELEEEPVVQSIMLRLAGDSFCNLEMFDDADRCFRRVANLEFDRADDEGLGFTEGTAAAEHDLGRIAWFRSRDLDRLAADARSAGREEEAVRIDRQRVVMLDAAENRYESALKARRILPVPPEDLAMTMQHLAAVHVASIGDANVAEAERRFSGGEELLKEALVIRARIRPRPVELLATTWNSLASLRARRGDEDGSIEAARRSAELVTGDASPEAWAGRAQSSLGRRLLDADRPDEAIDPLSRGLEICEVVFGNQSPSVLRTRRRLAEANLLVGAAGEAIEIAGAGMDGSRVPGGDPEQVLLALITVDALVQDQRTEEARVMIREIMSSSVDAEADRRWRRRLERLESRFIPTGEPDALDAVIDRRWRGTASDD